MFNVTFSNGQPVTQAWIVRQVCALAFCTDQAHAGLGVWNLPEATDGQGVVLDPGKCRDTITWTRRTGRK